MTGHSPGPTVDVLIVDDDAGIRSALIGVFHEVDLSVLSARDGGMALELLQGGLVPSVILMDMVMPEMDGRATIAAIRADPELGHLPIVAMTGASDVSALAVCAVVRKPFNADDVLRVLWPLVRGTPFSGAETGVPPSRQSA